MSNIRIIPEETYQEKMTGHSRSQLQTLGGGGCLQAPGQAGVYSQTCQKNDNKRKWTDTHWASTICQMFHTSWSLSSDTHGSHWHPMQ